jgi:hypothetical protein
LNKLKLNIYRLLTGLSEEDVAYFQGNDVERTISDSRGLFVDADQARNQEYTELVMETTELFAVVDPDGEILAEVATLEEAEALRVGAKVTFTIDLPKPVAAGVDDSPDSWSGEMPF